MIFNSEMYSLKNDSKNILNFNYTINTPFNTTQRLENYQNCNSKYFRLTNDHKLQVLKDINCNMYLFGGGTVVYVPQSNIYRVIDLDLIFTKNNVDTIYEFHPPLNASNNIYKIINLSLNRNDEIYFSIALDGTYIPQSFDVKSYMLYGGFINVNE